MPNERSLDLVVYYLKFCCRVYIGSTAELDQELMRFPNDELLATESGGQEVAQRRRRQFAEHHIAGGWFQPSAALMAHIKTLNHGAAQNVAHRLVPTTLAVEYTGRDRMTLYRWAREGRITRRGTKNRAMWDIWELPACIPGERLPSPPPLPKRTP